MLLNYKYKYADGYYNIGKAIEDGVAIVISDDDAKVTYLYDTINDKNLCFKYDEFSGGYHYLANKSIYESLISKMIRKFMPAVQYYPARINNHSGVLCEDWDNENTTYIPIYQSILNNKTSLIYNEIFADGKIYSDRITRKLATVENILDYKPELLELMSKNVFDTILKIPQHLMLGNFDFNVKNLAVNNNTETSNKALAFDFGFNAFCMLDKFLHKDIKFMKSDIKDAYLSFFSCFYPTTFGTGFRLNFADYDTFENFLKDFKYAVKNYPGMKQNLEEALSFSDKDLTEAMQELTEKDNIEIGFTPREIIKRTIDFNRETFSKCL